MLHWSTNEPKLDSSTDNHCCQFVDEFKYGDKHNHHPKINNHAYDDENDDDFNDAVMELFIDHNYSKHHTLGAGRSRQVLPDRDDCRSAAPERLSKVHSVL